MRESKIESHLVKRVKGLGGWAIKFPPVFLAGFPDRIVLLPGGRIIFIELKAPGEKPRELQVRRLNKLTALGFKTAVLDSREAVDEYLDAV